MLAGASMDSGGECVRPGRHDRGRVCEGGPCGCPRSRQPCGGTPRPRLAARPRQATPSGIPLSSLPSPKPPTGPPTVPTDPYPLDVIVGTVTATSSGPCNRYMLETDDGKLYALYYTGGSTCRRRRIGARVGATRAGDQLWPGPAFARDPVPVTRPSRCLALIRAPSTSPRVNKVPLLSTQPRRMCRN